MNYQGNKSENEFHTYRIFRSVAGSYFPIGDLAARGVQLHF